MLRGILKLHVQLVTSEAEMTGGGMQAGTAQMTDTPVTPVTSVDTKAVTLLYNMIKQDAEGRPCIVHERSPTPPTRLARSGRIIRPTKKLR